MVKNKKSHATFFFTHVHWDHIQGFPFFVPAFIGGNQFDLYGPVLKSAPAKVDEVLEATLRGQQQFRTFPIQLTDMAAVMKFHSIDPKDTITLKDGDHTLLIRCAPLIHPGGSLGYRLEERIKGRKTHRVFAFVTDTEHQAEPNPQVQKLMKNADLALYDAQFTDDEYSGKVGIRRVGWGHSTWTMGLREAEKAHLQHLVLTHHDPSHDDVFLKSIEQKAVRAGRKARIKVSFARQFSEFVL